MLIQDCKYLVGVISGKIRVYITKGNVIDDPYVLVLKTL